MSRINKDKHIMKQNRRSIGIILVLIVAVMAGFVLSCWVLLENAKFLGKDLVQSYALDEERSINQYENMVTLGMAYIDEQSENGVSEKETEEWVIDFFNKTKSIIKGSVVDTYAVMDGKLIASSNWEGMENYDVTSSAWYQQAVSAGGEVIFTDAYEDAAYGHQVVTIAAANPDTGNAIAFDLSTESFQASHKDLKLPEKSCYYVCDSAGSLLYGSVSFEASDEIITDYVNGLYGDIKAGELDKYNVIRDLDGKTRGVYYYKAPNGWTCILTIPYETLFDQLQGIYIGYVIIIAVLLIAAGLIWIRDRRLRKYIERTNDTVRVLGNSYYAIYRVNVKESTYEMIKGSDYVRQRLPYEGDYQSLLDVLVSCMDEETGKDFAKSFSLENIKQLARKKAMDFGGDFLRLFGDTYQWVNVRMIQDASLSRGEAVLCFRKVEKEKQQQLQHIRLMENALAAADASEKSQKQFFSGMSHDMRTPLNVIIGMADLALRPECTPEKTEDYLKKISMSSKQLLALINDILEMSRLEQGRLTLENKTFNICDILRGCSAPFETQAKDEEKVFRIQMDVSSPVVRGDSMRFSQILNNLISNAMKFTKKGDSITVSLREVESGKHARYLLVVEDTGIGMSEEFLPRLFEPYERETRFGAKSVMGTGLGMPIVKNLISQMGGEITVESALGKGSRFMVTLPFAVSTTEPVEEKVKTDFERIEGRKILLAEDNPLNKEIVCELLNMHDVKYETAENGKEALEKFRKSDKFFFDAILMDMQMPEMDGCEAARSIRGLHRPDAKRIPIIALTANAFAEDITKTAEAGMDAHLSKPIDANLLFSTLAKLISERS